MELLTALLVLIGTILVGTVYIFKITFTYWERKNISCQTPKAALHSVITGILQKESFGANIKNQYNWAKTGGYKDCGMFVLWIPVYMPTDPKIIKQILAVDFAAFSNRGLYHNKKEDPLTGNLFFLDGFDWKNLRVKLTPTFTSGKVKAMLNIVTGCGEKLQTSINRLISLNEPFNIGEFTGLFTMDVIGSCAFGLECNSFKNPNSEFIINSKRALQTNVLKVFMAFGFPNVSAKVGIRIFGEDITQFYLKIVKDTIEYREKNKISRNDFMQLLINIKNEYRKEETDKFGLEEIAAEAFIFFLAGYETSSSTMTFCLYELSINADIQDNVRKEIKSVLKKHNGKVTYEAIMEMKYLGQVIDETLRKYPPLPVLFRQTVADYKLPESSVILEKGTLVFIPSIGLHYDDEYFPHPDKFDPDRFSGDNKNKINPYTYLPFGEGPRNCIGLRFGLMQVKVGLTYLLMNYSFSLNKKTSIPLTMNPRNVNMSPVGGVWLNAIKDTL